MITRDQLIREYKARGNLPGFIVMYGSIVAVLGLTASAIV